MNEWHRKRERKKSKEARKNVEKLKIHERKVCKNLNRRKVLAD